MRADVYAPDAALRLEGPLLFLKRTIRCGLNEAVEIEDDAGRVRLGRIAALDHDTVTVEVLESTSGLALSDTRVRFLGEPLQFAVGPDMLGRVFDGVGRVIDGGPPVSAARTLRIDGRAINPAARDVPREFIETGVSTIDLMNSLVRGQKLPIFSGSGLPHDQLAIQIAQQARLREAAEGEFAIVFVAIGVPYDTAERFRLAMEGSGALEHTVLFLNLASDSSTQRLLSPRYALTAAEYLAFVEGRHVLVLYKGRLLLYRDPLDWGLAAGELRPGHYTIEKVKVLRDLFREKLIDKAEYKKRFRKILGLPAESR